MAAQMQRTPLSLKVVDQEQEHDLRPFFNDVARGTLRILWRRAWLVACAVALGLAVASAGIILTGPKYTSEALIVCGFAQSGQPAAVSGGSAVALEAANLVDSAARIVRSRATATSVVEKLGLDRMQESDHPRLIATLSATVYATLGLNQIPTTPRDMAVDALMRSINVTIEPRSYVITISASASSPQGAARLANAVAAEYLRMESLRRAVDAVSAAERELSHASQTYGSNHPTYIHMAERVQSLESQAAALRAGALTADALAASDAAYSFLPAKEVTTPSGPNVVAIYLTSAAVGLGLGVWLACSIYRPRIKAGPQNRLDETRCQ